VEPYSGVGYTSASRENSTGAARNALSTLRGLVAEDEQVESVGGSSVGRVQHAVFVRPHDDDAVGQALTPALARIDESRDALQLIVITPDAESAIEVASLATSRGATVPPVPVTSVRRAARVLRARPVRAIAGSAAELLALVRQSVLKLDDVSALVILWADDIVAAGGREPLEAVLAELPKDAARFLLTHASTPEIESIVEHFLFKARRVGDLPRASTSGIGVQYVTVTPAGRAAALRDVLDEVDPPSAIIVAKSAEAFADLQNALRLLGYDENDPNIRASRGEITDTPALVIFYEPPSTESELEAAGAGRIVALSRPRQVSALRALVGAGLAPFSRDPALTRGRTRAEKIRGELRDVLARGVPTGEILLLEPLLREHDGIELAAAALALLQQERASPAAQTVEQQRASAPAVETPRTNWPRLFINVGERDGAKPGDIVGVITGEAAIRGDRVGRIEMRDSHALVEVAPEVAEKVVEAVSGVSLKGRKLVARIDQRPAGGSPMRRGERSERGDRGPRRDRPERPERRSAAPRGDDRRPKRRERTDDDTSRPSPRAPRAMGEREEWAERGERVRHSRRPRRDEA
jgi:ATP-dependent RNA helicase DeaD